MGINLVVDWIISNSAPLLDRWLGPDRVSPYKPRTGVACPQLVRLVSQENYIIVRCSAPTKMGRGVWNVNEIDDGELISARLDGSDYEGRLGRAEAVTGGDYQVPWLASLIHTIPRFDLALRKIYTPRHAR